MQRTSLKDLSRALQALNLPRGRMVMVHSGLLKFGILEGGVAGVLEVLLDHLGQDGTLVMPAFSLEYGATRVWNYHETPSDAGALTEYFRKQTGTIRTLHPFHSVSVFGKEQDAFRQCKNLSSFGPGSPFDVLIQGDAVNLSLGTEFEGGASYLHHAEEEAQVPYRFEKKFPGQVYDSHGELVEQTFRMYVRIIRPEYQYLNNWDGVWKELQHLFRLEMVGHAKLYLSNINEVHRRFKKLLLADPFFSVDLQPITASNTE